VLYIYLSEDGKAVMEQEWHVGDSAPAILGRVVAFQADGDELEIIVAAINAASKPFVSPAENSTENSMEASMNAAVLRMRGNQ
jgi:hypothetical protein